MNQKIRDLPLNHLALAIRRGEISCLEVTDAYLEQIEEQNPRLNALSYVNERGARERAKTLDSLLARRTAFGSLTGVPITVKDSFAVESMPATCGMSRFRELVPARNAPAVARLLRLGTVILGKSNVPESLVGLDTCNPISGRTLNPHDSSWSPGGSSGGSAVAVASGMSVLDLASDLSGSIRIPASWCSVVGYRPSQGMLSKRSHLPWDLDAELEPPESVAGFVTRSATDLDALYRRLWPRRERPAPRRKRMLAIWTDPALALDGEVSCSLQRAMKALQAAGYELFDFSPPAPAPELVEIAKHLTQAEISFGLSEGEWMRRGGLDVRTYLHLLDRIKRFRLEARSVLSGADALLAPATPSPAPSFERLPEISKTADHWALAVSALQLPSITLPLSRQVGEPPVGVQLAGRHRSDSTLITLATELAPLLAG